MESVTAIPFVKLGFGGSSHNTIRSLRLRGAGFSVFHGGGGAFCRRDVGRLGPPRKCLDEAEELQAARDRWTEAILERGKPRMEFLPMVEAPQRGSTQTRDAEVR